MALDHGPRRSAVVNAFRRAVRRIGARRFGHLAYFYGHLRHRLLVVLGLSLAAGLMDGFGLAMFIPLMEFTASGDGRSNPASLGNLRFLVDGLVAAGLEPSLTVVLGAMLLFFVLKGAIAFLAQYKKVHYSQYFIRTLRERSIRALAEYEYAQYAQADIGRIQNTLTGEIARVSQAMTTYLGAINSAVLILLYSVLALLSNAKFAALVLVGAWISNRVLRSVYEQTERLSGEVTRVGHAFQRLLIQQSAHFKYLKATGRLRSYAEKLVQEVRRMEEVNRRIGVLGAAVGGVREPLMIAVVVVTVLVQVQVLGGSLTLILLSILFFYRALSHVLTLQGQWNGYLGLTGSIRNLTEFTAHLRQHRERLGPIPFERLSRAVMLHEVSFHYHRGRDILTQVTLEVRRNETIALVGESGSGKTTLMNVLAGLVVPTSGVVTVDGRPLGDLDVTSYQRRIGYITQEPVIFDDSILHNVTLWDEDTPVSRARAERALRQAQLAAFVEALPAGIHARLGHSGINLSGGQRQRVAIARELYKEVDILLMDEATSALDSESEHQIKANIDALKGRMTIVIAAHRLSTIRDADRVVLMRQGTVESVGTFDELAAGTATFRRMVELQTVGRRTAPARDQ